MSEWANIVRAHMYRTESVEVWIFLSLFFTSHCGNILTFLCQHFWFSLFVKVPHFTNEYSLFSLVKQCLRWDHFFQPWSNLFSILRMRDFIICLKNTLWLFTFFSWCINNANKNELIKIWLALEEQAITSYMDTLYSETVLFLFTVQKVSFLL